MSSFVGVIKRSILKYTRAECTHTFVFIFCICQLISAQSTKVNGRKNFHQVAEIFLSSKH